MIQDPPRRDHFCSEGRAYTITIPTSETIVIKTIIMVRGIFVYAARIEDRIMAPSWIPPDGICMRTAVRGLNPKAATRILPNYAYVSLETSNPNFSSRDTYCGNTAISNRNRKHGEE